MNERPTAADIEVTGNESDFCETDTVVLTPAIAVGSVWTTDAGNFNWYLDGDKTTLINDGDSNGSIRYAVDQAGVLTITGLSAGESPYTYFVSFTGENGCENLTEELKAVTVTVNPSATAADIDADDAVICIGDSHTLTASSSTVGNPIFTWYADADLTVELTDLNVSPAVTTTYYVTVQGEGICENISGEAAALTVTVNPSATAADIDADDAVICIGDSHTLTASNSTVTNPIFTWYADSDLTVELTDLNVRPTATTTYYVTVHGNGICENIAGEAAAVTVTVNPSATAEDIEAIGGEICIGDSFELVASSTIPDALFTWYADADLTVELTDLNVSPTATTTYYVTVQGRWYL